MKNITIKKEEIIFATRYKYLYFCLNKVNATLLAVITILGTILISKIFIAKSTITILNQLASIRLNSTEPHPRTYLTKSLKHRVLTAFIPNDSLNSLQNTYKILMSSKENVSL